MKSEINRVFTCYPKRFLVHCTLLQKQDYRHLINEYIKIKKILKDISTKTLYLHEKHQLSRTRVIVIHKDK